MRWIESLPKRLSFDTTYSHGNIYDLLKTILIDWTIMIPSNSCSEFALSNWPATGLIQNGVEQWLEDKNHKNLMILSMVLVNLYLAYYLSSSISQLNLSSIIELSEDQESRCLTSIRTTPCRWNDFRKLHQTGNPISTVLARILWKLV